MKTFKGLKISPGIAHGPLLYYERGKLPIPKIHINPGQVTVEFDHLKDALSKSHEELQQVRSLILNHLDEAHAKLIDMQILSLKDEEMLAAVKAKMIQRNINAAWAFSEVMQTYEQQLLRSLNQFFQDRYTDLHDIRKRVLHHLVGTEGNNVPKIEQPAIIVSDKISPSDLLHIKHSDVLGLVTQSGGVDSHVGILARAFRVPYISQVAEIEKIVKYDEAILDADEERILVDISPEAETRYHHRIQQFKQHREDVIKGRKINATRDGVPFYIFLNAGFVDELQAINPEHVQGIGLFRTEFLCIEKNAIPTEDVQYESYRQIIQNIQGLPVIFRVFDFGRDKLLSILDMDILQEDHVFDEWGGIRFCLDNPSILKTQLRALLRASQHGEIQIMLPLVTEVAEVQETERALATVRTELQQEGVTLQHPIPLGAMIETDSAMQILDELAAEVDFFSIGTNDLALYLLRSKRDEHLAKHYYHPIMFKAIKQIVSSAKKRKIPVNICGEMASDPYALIGLAALGIRSISVSSNALSQISELVSMISVEACQALESELLKANDSFQIYSILRNFYRENISK